MDTGSTHTFVHSVVAQRLGLTVTPRAGLSVMVVNGDRVRSSCVCLATLVTIGGKAFSIDCFALDLGSFDLVLGVQWLLTLGPIIWDFGALAMSFWYNGRSHHCTSMNNQGVAACTITDPCAVLEELLRSYHDIFEEPRGLPPPRRHDHRIHLLPRLHRWRCACTGTRSSPRTKSSDSARTCSAKGSSGSGPHHFPSRCSSSASTMIVGASTLTIAPSTMPP